MYNDYFEQDGFELHPRRPQPRNEIHQFNQVNRVRGQMVNNQAPRGVPQFDMSNMGDELEFVDGVPQLIRRAPARGGGDSHFRPVIMPNSSAVVTPVVRNGRAFEVKPHYLGHLPELYGKRIEEPYLHIAAFESICSTVGGAGFTKDQVMLMLFQFTLKDRARQWFPTLTPGSIFTWQ